MERVEGQDLRRISEAARNAGYVFPVSLALYVAGDRDFLLAFPGLSSASRISRQ